MDGADRSPASAGPGLYGTSDFYLACFLRCSGYELAGMRPEGRRWVFVYRDRPSRPRDVTAFYGDRAAVAPLRFAAAIRSMKAMLHGVRPAAPTGTAAVPDG